MSSTQAYNYDTVQRMLLQSMLAQTDSIPYIINEVVSDDFTNEKYREIFRSLIDLSAKEVRITPAELYKDLTSKNITFLEEDFLLFSNPPIDTPESLAWILRKQSALNNASNVYKGALKELSEGADLVEVIGRNQDELEKVVNSLTNDSAKQYKETVDDVFDKALSTRQEEAYFVPTGYETLDYYLSGGMKPGQLVTIAARTGVGKTVAATNMTATACAAGKSVLFFSLEMSAESMIKRLAACYGNILLTNLEPSPTKSPELIDRIKSTRRDMKGWKLEIIDESEQTMEQIKAACVKKSKSQEGLDLVVIDYLQLINVKKRGQSSRQEDVAELSRSAKVLARRLGIPVIILVQLNREDKNESEDRLPSKADIRETAAIAADSDIVLIIHRKYRDDSPDPKALFILDKQRGGPADKIFNVRCVLEKNIFQDLRSEINANKANANNEANNNEIASIEAIALEEPDDFGYASDVVDMNVFSGSGGDYWVQDDNISDDDFDYLFEDD